MKRLIALVIVLALGWAGYWFVGAWGVKSGFAHWFETRQDEGWLAEYDDLTVRGFPNRFDSTFTGLSLADPDTGLAWEMPFFQLFALSYKPNHLIAVWPNSQTVSTPDEKRVISTGDMRASLVVGADRLLPIERANLAIEKLGIVSTKDWTLSADAVRLAVRLEEGENRYRLALETDALAPPASLRGLSDDLPETLHSVKADIYASFDRTWDRRAIEERRPQPQVIDIKLAEIAWGDLMLHAAGKVDVDAFGTPSGDITIRATNWREILTLAQASGRMGKGMADTLRQGLEILSGMSGNPETLDIPLTFRRGRMQIGLIPIGPAPVLKLH